MNSLHFTCFTILLHQYAYGRWSLIPSEVSALSIACFILFWTREWGLYMMRKNCVPEARRNFFWSIHFQLKTSLFTLAVNIALLGGSTLFIKEKQHFDTFAKTFWGSPPPNSLLVDRIRDTDKNLGLLQKRGQGVPFLNHI